ncbi:hypothetical protein GDO81_025373 [Engystomops pustulosus]|uniref:Uncharacterized protein n=1 Tax=Engystomops pustulosus TaxID=76066 RepID=A0AAV6YP35_ENGPU|nr:hypothetical protein GDO81_025373 [Engystomops pustulosus]
MWRCGQSGAPRWWRCTILLRLRWSPLPPTFKNQSFNIKESLKTTFWDFPGWGRL